MSFFDQIPVDDFIGWHIIAIVSAIIFIFFLIAAIGLLKRLYCIEFIWVFLKPSAGMKCTATISACCYSIFYAALMISFSALIIMTESGTLKSETNIKDGFEQSVTIIFMVITATSYIFGILFYHYYILTRINYHINTYYDIMPMPLYRKYRVYCIAHILMILFAADLIFFAVLRSGEFDYSDTISNWSFFLILIALIIEFTISLTLLFVYIWSFHVLSRYYFRFDNKKQIDQKQHEHMIRASRFSVVGGLSIIFALILYCIQAVAIYTHWEPIESFYGVITLGSVVAGRDISVFFALCFGFDFGHTTYLKYCSCCHKLAYWWNENMVNNRNEKKYFEIQIRSDDAEMSLLSDKYQLMM